VYGSLTMPVALFHHFTFACIHIWTWIREKVFTVEPQFECTIIRLAVPEGFRTGFHYHLCSVRSPRIAENEETWFQETFRHIIRQCAFFTFCCKILDSLVFREQFTPWTVVTQHLFFIGQFGIAETWVGIIGERDVGIEHDHLFDCIQIVLREFITESINIRNTQSFAENIDCCQMVVWVEFELSAVIIYLNVNLTIQNIDTTFSPCRGIFKLREECTCIDHTLSFK